MQERWSRAGETAQGEPWTGAILGAECQENVLGVLKSGERQRYQKKDVSGIGGGGRWRAGVQLARHTSEPCSHHGYSSVYRALVTTDTAWDIDQEICLHEGRTDLSLS